MLFSLLAVIPVELIDLFIVKKVVDFFEDDFASCATGLVQINSALFSVDGILVVG